MKVEAGMVKDNGAPYSVAGKKTVAQTGDLRVVEFTLGPAEAVPWHEHSVVTDVFYCLAGELEVGVQGSDASFERVVLRPGDSLDVPPKTPHMVANVAEGVSRYLNIQGVGAYDFIRLPEPGAEDA